MLNLSATLDDVSKTIAEYWATGAAATQSGAANRPPTGIFWPTASPHEMPTRSMRT